MGLRNAWAAGLAALAASAPGIARAAVIRVTPSDSYDKIESAGPGDEVVIAPGTYAFRVYLTRQAPASSPIVIHAEDPSNPPVWDLGSTLVEAAPGSYGGGDKGRGCWQVSGGTNYVIESIVFTHCRTSSYNSAGIRYYNGASGIIIRDCVFRDNDDGITGGTQDSDATVEFSEFDHNGNPSASNGSPTHNLYIYGGTFTLRYSWVHDPAQAQNFHIRAKQATLEDNFFARAASYEGDLMTDDDYAGGSTFVQSIVLRGNVFLQGTTQSNTGQIFVLYNDTQATGLTLEAHILYNTVVGAGGHAAFVHLSNADGTPMQAEIDDNVVYGTSVPVLIEDATHGSVTGTHNWMASGTNPGPLASTVFGASPGFANATGEDFHLASGSSCIGAAASVGIADLPDAEYWRDEIVTRMVRSRATLDDIGAFESTTTAPPTGPYDAGEADSGLSPMDSAGAPVDAGPGPTPSDSGAVATPDAVGADVIAPGDAQAADAGALDARSSSDGAAVAGADSGCSCRAPNGPRAPTAVWAILAALGAWARRRRRVRSSGP